MQVRRECSSSVGELDADTCSVGEGVTAVMEANVLVEVLVQALVVQTRGADTTLLPLTATVCVSLVTPAVDTGLISSLEARRGRFPALTVETAVVVVDTCECLDGTTSE